MKYSVLFYTKENGERPVCNYLDSLPVKPRAKLVGMIKILEDVGRNLREPYSKYLEDGIFELRSIFGNDISRLLYFFEKGGKIIIVSGFTKKQNKTPRSEIELAKKRREDYFKREGERNAKI